jgi:hypothetical protein
VAHEDDVFELQLLADLQHILGVAVERAVFRPVVSRHVRGARADMVEEHHAEVVLEGRRDEPPHVLITTEAVREQHRFLAATGGPDVVACDDSHGHSRGSEQLPEELN